MSHLVAMIKIILYNMVNIVIGRCLWTTVLEYRNMDDVTGNLFFFALLSMAQGFENVCKIILD